MGLEDRRKREREQRRNAILNAARKLFLEKGFKHVTVENIARKAELSKGSVYLYFSSKEEIYTQILLNDIDKFNRKSSQIFQNGKPAAVLVMDFACIYVDFFLNDRELFRIMMTFMLHTEELNLTEAVNQHIIDVTNNTVKIIETILQHGIDRGEFPRDINLGQSRNALWGLLNGIISLHLFTGREANKEERIRSTIKGSLSVFINGLKTYRIGEEILSRNRNFQNI
jgi:AcrR family transcriptional regulator